MKNINKISSNRLNYTDDLSPVIERLCEVYKLGKLISFSIIDTGYEDCNVFIKTLSGDYVAKMFSKERSQEDIIRYSSIMEKVVDAGINHPPLIRTIFNEVVYCDKQANQISMVLMKFVSGKTFFELNRAPNKEEAKQIIEQAVKINKINYHPLYIFDSWAIPNIKTMFDKVKKFVNQDDAELVEHVISKFAEVSENGLPKCFVHGDFTKANVLIGDDGKIYILDFSVSNWYPRIQELAVVCANLLYDNNNPVSLNNRVEFVLSEYDKLSPLSEEEKNNLYVYSLAGVAMEFIGAHLEKFIKGNDSEETEYWLNLGRNGLKREFISK
jgi:Ser/Thr protein kinase RdoA (MazF antagonist)